MRVELVGELAGHLVERSGKVLEFVPARHLDPRVQAAQRETARGLLEPVQRLQDPCFIIDALDGDQRRAKIVRQVADALAPEVMKAFWAFDKAAVADGAIR